MTTVTTHSYATPQDARTRPTAVAVWLFAVAFLVFLMICVGGATRLTDSGLSITEWQPILGAIPPLSEADWHLAFEKYRQIPEYHLVNAGMSLAEFKSIYWWEWSHRFLGRFIGIAFALPLAGFWLAGWLPRGLRARMLGVLALGSLQGFIGWYMVKSGLVDRIDVSQYRLALHLFVAFVIFAALVWLALRTWPDGGAENAGVPPHHYRLALIIGALVLAQVVLGAFVAGLKAGLTYNTWPLMDGRFIPNGLGALHPWWLNAFENVTTVQFNHRIGAYVLLAATAVHAWSLRRSAPRTPAAASSLVLFLAVLAQAALGIWTLLAAVPIQLGILHQAGAAAVLGVAVWHLSRVFPRASAGPRAALSLR